jgi:hypothetical protein
MNPDDIRPPSEEVRTPERREYVPEARPLEERTIEIVGGGTIAEAFGGAVVCVLAIIALAGIPRAAIVEIAVMVLGASFLAQGLAIAARYRRILVRSTSRWAFARLSTGMRANIFVGVTGIALGIIALAGVAPLALDSIAVILYGGALLSGTSINLSLSELTGPPRRSRAEEVAEESLPAATGAQVMIGLGAIVLGILALANVAPAVLVPVALLGVGASLLLSGTAVGVRMMSELRH